MSALDRLTDVFREALGIPADTELDSLRYGSIVEWDSVGHMRLVAAIESAFGVMLETDDVIGMSDLARAREILRKHGVVA